MKDKMVGTVAVACFLVAALCVGLIMHSTNQNNISLQSEISQLELKITTLESKIEDLENVAVGMFKELRGLGAHYQNHEHVYDHAPNENFNREL